MIKRSLKEKQEGKIVTIEIWLIIALSISGLFNLFFLWFAREQSQRLSYVSQNVGDLLELLESYRMHLRRVYSMDMFYGDETLQYLMEHTSALINLLEDEYSDVLDITEPLEEVYMEEEDEEKEIEEEQRQDVFYGGTRSSNP